MISLAFYTAWVFGERFVTKELYSFKIWPFEASSPRPGHSLLPQDPVSSRGHAALAHYVLVLAQALFLQDSAS